MTRKFALPTTLAIAVIALSLPGVSTRADDYQKLFKKQQEGMAVFGAGNCANCHDGKAGKRDDGSRLMTYSEWRGAEDTGPHFNAFKTLHNDQSKRMAQILARYDGSNADPTQRTDCLACHAFAHDIPSEQKGREFDLFDGVSCEACHGRAEGWKAKHELENWREQSRDEWLKLGMYETRDVNRWAEMCLKCHLGSDDQTVSHTLMGAGHPDLSFEFFGDLYRVPKHWRDERSWLSADEGSWFAVRLWAVGQAVTLRENMNQIARSLATDGVPDFALFDCFACHHELQNASWRQQRALSSRVPGQPAWDASSWVVSRHLVDVVWPEASPRFAEHIATIATSLTLSNPDRERVRAAAVELADLANQLASKVVTKRFGLDDTKAIIMRIARDAEYAVTVGPRGAEQVFGALYALYRVAWVEAGPAPKGNVEIQKALAEIRSMLFDDKHESTPANFDADLFRKSLKNIAESLAE